MCCGWARFHSVLLHADHERRQEINQLSNSRQMFMGSLIFFVLPNLR